MKKLIVFLCAALISSTAMAHGHYGGYRGGGWGWVAPAMIGAGVGYMIAQPRVYAAPVYTAPTYVAPTTPVPGQPVYQYQNVWMDDCQCYRNVLVRIQ